MDNFFIFVLISNITHTLAACAMNTFCGLCSFKYTEFITRGPAAILQLEH